MNTNTMISAGRIAASTAAWTASPAVMALTESEWGVLAGLHFAGDDVLLADLSPRVVDAYLSDPDVTQPPAYLSDPDVTRPPAEMPRLMLRVTRCTDPAAWHAGKVGELVKFVCAGVGCWMVRDDAGTLQRIDLEDADLVEVRGGVVSSIVS